MKIIFYVPISSSPPALATVVKENVRHFRNYVYVKSFIVKAVVDDDDEMMINQNYSRMQAKPMTSSLRT